MISDVCIFYSPPAPLLPNGFKSIWAKGISLNASAQSRILGPGKRRLGCVCTDGESHCSSGTLLLGHSTRQRRSKEDSLCV